MTVLAESYVFLLEFVQIIEAGFQNPDMTDDIHIVRSREWISEWDAVRVISVTNRSMPVDIADNIRLYRTENRERLFATIDLSSLQANVA